MQSDCCDSNLITLPDDVLVIISRFLSPRDICNLSLCSRALFDIVDTDKFWFTQCDILGIVPISDLIEWRLGVLSYKALCHFLLSVQPLLGIWVHQNPELGNVVYAMPGFVSVIGCRIIPQELGPLGIEDGPILWAPVFEILGQFDGSAAFFLHGREREEDYLYPGSLKAVDRTCNVLLLEVEHKQYGNDVESIHGKNLIDDVNKDSSERVCRTDCDDFRSERAAKQNLSMVSFGRLSFGDRRKLLDIVTSQVRLRMPEFENCPLFPRPRLDDNNSFQKDIRLISNRRLLLMQLYKEGKGQIDCGPAVPEQPFDPTQLEISQIRKRLDGDLIFMKSSKRKSLGGFFRNGLKQILGKSISISASHPSFKNGSSSSKSRQALLNEFLRSGDTIGLTLHASTVKLSSYRSWPNMHDSRFALYKLPIRELAVGQDYAGLWGGTFGWPPGRPTEDKRGKALFFLLLSYYKEPQGKTFLIATKILEGTHYVLHPNGSAMFIVDVNEPSLDPFPWNNDMDSLPMVVQHAFMGDGIANGYGFRYPGSKPGSLYVISDGLLAFIWKESRSILTLQRLNLQELLKKGERVPTLPPIANFSYLTKSYSNVFAGFSNTSSCFSSPRLSHANVDERLY